MKKKYKLNQDTFNSVASGYADHAFTAQYMKKFIDEFVEMLQPGSRILDLGCGPGNDCYLFREEGFDVVGVDFSENMINEAKQRVPEATFIQENILDLSFEPESFDAVWSVGTLHFIDHDDFTSVVKCIHYWLKNGGKAFIATKSGTGEGVETQEQVGVGSKGDKFWPYWKREDLENLLNEIGFSILKITETKAERKGDLPKGFDETWLNVWLEK